MNFREIAIWIAAGLYAFLAIALIDIFCVINRDLCSVLWGIPVNFLALLVFLVTLLVLRKRLRKETEKLGSKGFIFSLLLNIGFPIAILFFMAITTMWH